MLFMLFLLVKSFDNAYFTDDGQLILPEPIVVDTYPYGTRQNLDESGWKNIRIKLNYSYITGELRESLSCYEVGQVIQLTSSKSVTCTKEMIVSNKDLTNLTIAMNNLKSFAEKFLRVIPTPNQDYDIEYFVKIIRYPRGSDVIAKAGALTRDKFERPLQAHVLIKDLELPNYVSEFETNTSAFANVMFHEFTHALYALQQNYHYRNSTLFYPERRAFCSMKKYGKTYKFITGPYSHIFAQKHYGIDVFEGDDKNCTSGIEIEDGGGPDTKGFHIKASRFYSDLNIGMSTQSNGMKFERITDATIAILQDTGNYICNWSMAQPLVWGNPESQIGGKPIKDFALGPPQLVFPKHYLKQQDEYQMIPFYYQPDYVGFDFKYFALDFGLQRGSDCSGDWEKLCTNQEFYNPLKKNRLCHHDIFDYTMVKVPYEAYCEKGEAMIPGYAYCRKYICNKYESFTLITPELKDIYGNQTNLTCTKENPNKIITAESTYYSGYTNITCVHPELFCRTVKLSEMHFVRDPLDPDLNVRQLDDYDNNIINNSNNNNETDEKSNSTNKSNNIIKIVIPCVVVGVIIIAAIIITVIVIRKKRHSNKDKSDNDIELNDQQNDYLPN
ncbi:GP63-like [Trichomonas vaginalis G3]|uniref:GP63-like n=1 Tax=Trichomonas vaginalis (strain ATCC PRA-98 / G3) TaxID=412133 RepID=A2EYJ1_TRIV3|nr:regulation of choline O-acetyltransferase protein [Trichomonas vaginalis G3]EAY02267.1 GP63-like [Trichomonas vaginalis G3]KAI5522905.1 regulation of choline O-acetyltransferase protein [Trichomonas vaginalis G3]|eukprot:XP_001314584.1 GP63-like [Trichomonas vaginalis G3]